MGVFFFFTNTFYLQDIYRKNYKEFHEEGTVTKFMEITKVHQIIKNELKGACDHFWV